MDAIEKGNVSANANRDLAKRTSGRKKSVEKLELFLKEIVEQGRCPRP